jgi:thiosulfate/3-mercaptopyruvate sulfurtransferase
MPDGPLVSTQWLADRLDDPGVRILDCRWYLRPFDWRNGDDEYARAHIPGAVHARWDTDLADPERPDLWMLAGPDRFADAMASRGIGDDTFVVTYDDQHVTVAARVWWALRVYGHTGVTVLDGGINKWQAEGRPTDDTVPRYPRAQFTPRYDPSLYATHQQMRDAVGTSTRLVDGRMAGAREADGGAIPGSITAPGIEFTGADGTWAEPEEARRRLAAAGARAPEPTIAYCRGGVGACGTALAYAIAGHDDVAVYDGSWTEWITDPEAPRAMDSGGIHPTTLRFG